MDLKNMDMAQLKEKVLAVADKKTLIKFGIGFGSIVLFLIIYYAILNPMVKDRKAKFDDKVKKQNEISQFNSEIIQLKADLEKMNPEFKKSSTLFHSKAEVEGLYNSLSIYAANNGLVISRIAKQKPIPVLKDGVREMNRDENKNNYIWIRRFESEQHKEKLYKEVYESEEWINEIGPKVAGLIDRNSIRIHNLISTELSIMK